MKWMNGGYGGHVLQQIKKEYIHSMTTLLGTPCINLKSNQIEAFIAVCTVSLFNEIFICCPQNAE